MRPLARMLVELCICTTLALTAGCQRNLDPASVEYWADQASRQGAREEALKELGKLGKKEAVPVLLKWLDQPGPWQGQAAYSLAQLGDPSVAPQLIKHLDYEAGAQPKGGNTDAVYTNLDIVRGLALLRSPEAVEPLLKLLKNPEPKTREVVINALGQLQARQAVQPLLDLAQAESTPPVLVAASLRTLGNLGAAEAAPTLTTLLYHDVLYEEARYALVQLGPQAVPVLTQTLNRQNKDVEAKKMADGKPLPDGAVEARAASVLGAMRAHDAEPAVVAAFDKLYKRYLAKPKEAPPSVFGAIIELAYALGNLGGPGAVKALLPLTKAPNDTLHVAAAEALTTAGPDAGSVQALLAAAGTGPADARDSLIHAVTRLGGSDVLPAVEALKKSADKAATPEVLAHIVEAASPRLVAAKECKEDGACWRGKLQAKEAPVVRERAAYEMGWLAVKDAQADLLKAAEDESPEVRMAAVLSLQRLNGSDPVALQKIYDAWQTKTEYAAANQELKCLIARSKGHKG